LIGLSRERGSGLALLEYNEHKLQQKNSQFLSNLSMTTLTAAESSLAADSGPLSMLKDGSTLPDSSLEDEIVHVLVRVVGVKVHRLSLHAGTHEIGRA